MSNVDTVKEIYAAFGRGDVPAILDHLDQNVEWETTTEVPGVPWLAPRHGKANVPGFFESLAPLQITRFEPRTFFADGDKVFVIIHFEADHNGKHYTIPNNGHLWEFGADGKVVRYDHITDTATHQRLAGGE